MKKLFDKLAGVKSPSSHLGLDPKFVVPPVPHPCPHDHIALLATKDGLLLRPHVPELTNTQTYVRVAWGKNVHVEELDGDLELEGCDWSKSAIIYGIVGVLELFSGMIC
jgi:phosphatidylinositol 4-phosphatase